MGFYYRSEFVYNFGVLDFLLLLSKQMAAVPGCLYSVMFDAPIMASGLGSLFMS